MIEHLSLMLFILYGINFLSLFIKSLTYFLDESSETNNLYIKDSRTITLVLDVVVFICFSVFMAGYPILKDI